ncbi:hypothetical protein HanIR_Chr11g0511621 [Helianthus annuus]|nr:hypothetical protein HanIR_Chr11g0511621 [Helianthus annuus]
MIAPIMSAEAASFTASLMLPSSSSPNSHSSMMKVSNPSSMTVGTAGNEDENPKGNPLLLISTNNTWSPAVDDRTTNF